jgi:hypothetical protein
MIRTSTALIMISTANHGHESEKGGDNEVRSLGMKLFAPVAPLTNRVHRDDSDLISCRLAEI